MSEAREAAERAYPEPEAWDGSFRWPMNRACRIAYERGYNDAMAKAEAEQAWLVVTDAQVKAALDSFGDHYDPANENADVTFRRLLEAALSVKGGE